MQVTDPNNNVTVFQYDPLGHVTSETDPLQHTLSRTYDLARRLQEEINRNGLRSTFQYDGAGRLRTETWFAADGSLTDTLTYTYNAAGQLLTAANNAGTYTFLYNDAGQLIEVAEPFGVSLTFGYDAGGHRTTVSDSLGGEIDSVYNANGQLVQETYVQDGQVLLRIDQTYNAQGQVATQIRYSDAGQTEVAETDYTYNEAGEVTDIHTTSADGSTLADYAYSYAPSGLLLSETDNGVVVGNYTYDQTGTATTGDGLIPQLTSDGMHNYSYDPAGNRTGDGYSIGNKKQETRKARNHQQPYHYFIGIVLRFWIFVSCFFSS